VLREHDSHSRTTNRHLAFGMALACVMATGIGCQPASPMAGRDDPSGATGQTLIGKQGRGAAPATEGNEPGRKLWESVVTKYQTARAYQDQGYVWLRYKRQGKTEDDRAPLSVRIDRQASRMHLNVYGVRWASDGTRCQAMIVDPTTNDLDHQFRVAGIQAPLTLEQLYVDPILAQSLQAGLAGPAPQLELLLSTEPLSGLVTPSTIVRLDSQEAIDGRMHERLILEEAEVQYVIWIDPKERLIRRIELPWQVAMPLVQQDAELESIAVSIELEGATWTIDPTATWRIEPPADARVVADFVAPPPPLVSELIGRQPKQPLVLREGVPGKSFEEKSLRRAAIMLWVADHPSSAQAARRMQQVVDDLDGQVQRELEFFVVNAEPQGKTLEMIQSWGVGMPWLDDRTAVGRDALGIGMAPALVAIDQRGMVQLLEPQASPELLAQLKEICQRLARGDDLAAEMRGRFEQAREEYLKRLQAVRPTANASR
jgi:hypothetical protein